MDITPEAKPNLIQINGYSNGGFRINGRRFEGTVCLLPTGISNPPLLELSDLNGNNWPKEVLDQTTDLSVLLVGTGTHMRLIPKPAKTALAAVGLHCEPMSTGAGCRTFNVLIS